MTPARLQAWDVIPEWLLVVALRLTADSKWFDIVVARHANAARDEMRLLAMEFRELARQASVEHRRQKNFCGICEDANQNQRPALAGGFQDSRRD